MRQCLRCKLDLTDIMGVMIFVRDERVPVGRGVGEFKRVDGLLCVNCGNSNNVMGRAEYEGLLP